MGGMEFMSGVPNSANRGVLPDSAGELGESLDFQKATKCFDHDYVSEETLISFN